MGKKQIMFRVAKDLQPGDLMDYTTKDAQGRRETAEVQSVIVAGKETTVVYLDRKREPETMHFASDEEVQLVIKREVGRPAKPDRKQRINVTLSPDTLAELEKRIPEKQRSAFIENLIRQALNLPDRE